MRDLKSPPTVASFSSLPPLQPISVKDSCSSIIQLAKTNGINVPDSLIMTPVIEEDVSLVCFKFGLCSILELFFKRFINI